MASFDRPTSDRLADLAAEQARLDIEYWFSAPPSWWRWRARRRWNNRRPPIAFNIKADTLSDMRLRMYADMALSLRDRKFIYTDPS